MKNIWTLVAIAFGLALGIYIYKLMQENKAATKQSLLAIQPTGVPIDNVPKIP
jgi:hypothetical protein